MNQMEKNPNIAQLETSHQLCKSVCRATVAAFHYGKSFHGVLRSLLHQADFISLFRGEFVTTVRIFIIFCFLERYCSEDVD